MKRRVPARSRRLAFGVVLGALVLGLSTPRAALAAGRYVLGIDGSVLVAAPIDPATGQPIPVAPIVAITRVYDGSAAQRAGLEVDDQILSVNGRTFRDYEHFRSMIMRGGPVVRLVIRDKRTGRLLSTNIALGYVNE